MQGIATLLATGTALVLFSCCTSAHGFQMDPSFSMSVNGLAEAHFFTYQQRLQRGQLPWGVHDEWVQFVYPGDASMVFSIAVVSPKLSTEPPAAVAVPVTTADLEQPLQWLQQAAEAHLTGRGHSPQHISVQSPCLTTGCECSTCQVAGQAPDGMDTSCSAEPGSALPTASDPAAAVKTRVAESCALPALKQSTQAAKEPAAAAAASSTTAEAAPAAVTSSDAVLAPDMCVNRNYMLYLGMSIPGGGTVSEAAMDAFLVQEVHTRLAGFTMWTATGFWKGVPEATTVLEVIGTGSSMAADVGAIAAAYKRTFCQEAVLVKQNACPAVSFV